MEHDTTESCSSPITPIYSYTIVTAAVIILYFICSFTATWLFHLSHIPGPRWAAFTRCWLLKTLASERSAEKFVEINEKYGSLARIGPNLLLTSDPEIWRKILGARSSYERGPWFDCLRLDPRRANLITERNRTRHNALRYKMASGYEGKDVEGFEKTIDENLTEWIEYIEKNALSSSGTTIDFDIARSVQWLDFDLICRLCFGHPLGFINAHSDRYDFQKTLEERLPIVELLGVLTEFGSILNAVSYVPYLKGIIPSAEDKGGIGKILGLARKVVNARFDPGAVSKNDIIDSWLKRGVERSQVETEMVIALFAGSDTTATSIRSTLLYIISNPLVYRRLVAEIEHAVAIGAISSIASTEEARRLPYLQACIKEGIRIFPPIAALRERTTPPEGDTLQGHFIPGGVNIGINLRGLLLNEVAFRPDPKTFRPERWLESDPKQLLEMERVHELVFNWGFTRCLGIHLANVMINKFLIECFRRWDVTILDPLKPWMSRCHGVFYQRDMFVRITPRAEGQ